MRISIPKSPMLSLVVVLVIASLATATYISAQMLSGAGAPPSESKQDSRKVLTPDEIFSDDFESGDTSAWETPPANCDTAFELPTDLVD